MIEWMQKHKKYLVITIWISTIAFIAAGMIGWGQYSFSITGDTIAKVGDIKISQQEFQNQYNRIFENYSQIVGQEQAKLMQLDQMTLNNLIQQALLRNFAKDLGLRVEDSEVIDTIKSIDTFQRDGKFDEVLYKHLLRDNNLKPSDFEKTLRENLLLEKITNLLPNNLTPLETEALSSPYRIQDEVKLQVINIPKNLPKITDTELKDFWEKTKNDYQKPASFDIEYIYIQAKDEKVSNDELLAYYKDNPSNYLNQKGEVENFDQAKQKVENDLKMQKAQSDATKKFIELKKGTISNTKTENILQDSKEYPVEILQELQNAKLNAVIKPIAYKNGYITMKLIKKIPSMPKSFEEAKQEALKSLENENAIQALKKEAQNTLNNFEGKNIGFIDLTFKKPIEGLNESEVIELVKNIFSTQTKLNFAIIGKKAILYKIISQKFKEGLNNDDRNKLVQQGINLKTQYLDTTLIDYLEKKYTIKKYQH